MPQKCTTMKVINLHHHEPVRFCDGWGGNKSCHLNTLTDDELALLSKEHLIKLYKRRPILHLWFPNGPTAGFFISYLAYQRILPYLRNIKAGTSYKTQCDWFANPPFFSRATCIASQFISGFHNSTPTEIHIFLEHNDIPNRDQRGNDSRWSCLCPWSYRTYHFIGAKFRITKCSGNARERDATTGGCSPPSCCTVAPFYGNPKLPHRLLYLAPEWWFNLKIFLDFIKVPLITQLEDFWSSHLVRGCKWNTAPSTNLLARKLKHVIFGNKFHV